MLKYKHQISFKVQTYLQQTVGKSEYSTSKRSTVEGVQDVEVVHEYKIRTENEEKRTRMHAVKRMQGK